MDTKEQIVALADHLIRDKGYNAFSFYDISKAVGIKTASIHYHFPSKSDLGISVIDQHINNLQVLKEKFKNKTPLEKLNKFFSIYINIQSEDKICLVGSLATDFQTLDGQVKERLKMFSNNMLEWVSDFLQEGRTQNQFHFEGEPRTKAIIIIGNMLSIVQLSRITGENDIKTVIDSIKQDLIKK